MKHSVDPIACVNHDEVCSCMNPKMTSPSLPELVDLSCIDCVCGNDCATKIKDALAIAWEALSSIENRSAIYEREARDALRRIRALGESK